MKLATYDLPRLYRSLCHYPAPCHRTAKHFIASSKDRREENLHMKFDLKQRLKSENQFNIAKFAARREISTSDTLCSEIRCIAGAAAAPAVTNCDESVVEMCA